MRAIKWLSEQNDIDASNVNVNEVAIRFSEFDTMADAIIAAAGVNASHGLKRQRGDIKNAIRSMLEVNRIRFMTDKFTLNADEIIKVVNCSRSAYERETKEIRQELTSFRDYSLQELRSEGYSTHEISLRTGVPLSTVKRILACGSKTDDAEMSQNKDQGALDTNFNYNGVNVQSEERIEDVENFGYDSESSENDSEETAFTHITTAVAIANPWDEIEKNSVMKSKANVQLVTFNDDELKVFLASLSSRQRALALNYLTGL